MSSTLKRDSCCWTLPSATLIGNFADPKTVARVVLGFFVCPALEPRHEREADERGDRDLAEDVAVYVHRGEWHGCDAAAAGAGDASELRDDRGEVLRERG